MGIEVEYEAAELMHGGHEALRRGEWHEARFCFDAAFRVSACAEAAEGLGMAAWWLDDSVVAIEARETAYRTYRERGAQVDAARIAIWLAWDYLAFRGEPAVANGWVQRAHRLLDDLEATPEHGWLAIREGEIAIMVQNDPSSTCRLARRARALGRELDESDIELSALALEGLALVSEGRVAEGIRQLDEASVAAVAGEMSQLWAVGRASCYLVTACERVRDFDRASQWCRRMLEFAKRWRIPSLFAVCRAHYASVLVWRGTWDQAELELEAARRELAIGRPGLGFEAVVRLGELRRRQGRLEEARALLSEIEFHPVAQLELAAIALDDGDPDKAVQLAERFLRKLSPENLLQRAEALELLVRALVALPDLERARGAATELSAVVADIGTDLLRASWLAADAGVRAAESNLEAARERWEDAVELFRRCGTPFETAHARLELGLVLSRLGRPDDAARQIRAARDTLREMRADRDADRAAALLRRLDEEAAVETAASLTGREIEVLQLVARGLSNPEIAHQLKLSEHTVHRHLANILGKLQLTSRAAATAWAVRSGVV